MSKLSALKRAALAVIVSVPAGILFGPAIAGIGATAAHAGGEIDCVAVNTTVPPVTVTPGSCGTTNTNDEQSASNPAIVAINVCDGGTGGAYGPDADDVKVASSGNTQIWADLQNPTGPQGMAEVDGVGIASNQTGC